MFETEGLKPFLDAANTSAGNRVYPRRLPQGVVLPAVVYFMVSPGISYVSNGQSSLQTPRYQFDCWGASYITAKTLAKELKTLLSGYAGLMGSRTVTAVFIDDERDDDDPDTNRYWTSLDVTIHHT